VSKRIAFLAATLAAAAGLAVPAAQAAPNMLVGINDEANTLYGNPSYVFPLLKQLRSQALRVNLYWGGTKWAVATRRPADAMDPGDPAYNWRIYDRLVRYASQYDIKVVFSILFTPGWANGGKDRRYPPTDFKDLQNFAYAAAERYSGLWTPPPAQRDPNNASSSTPLPAVKMWTAWNEPNNPIWLQPQYKRVGKTWRIESAVNYAKICNAIYDGVHSQFLGPLQGEQVACGVTGPRGNDAPKSGRASVDPMSFLTATKRFGLKKFDVWAHHPYYAQPTESPTYKPKGHTIQLGNIGTLITQLTKLYGPKHLWITEYGYQTNPTDKIFGVSWLKQAQYLTQAYAIARKNPRIDMMLWFLIKDEPKLAGWQSGFMTPTGKKKPSFAAFAKLPH
jgi:hypothetical protein